MLKQIVVISAHPDDEIIGAGGTLLKHVSKGDHVHWIIVTNVTGGGGFAEERIESRQIEIDKVARSVGFASVHKLDYPTMQLTPASLISLIPKISDLFSQIKPEIIYCLNRSDAHSDHRVVFDAVMACTKSFRYPFIKQVLMYECISETEFAPALPEKAFMPNYFVDVSETLKQKLEIAAIYESEFADHPFPRSIENITALATFRGASVGVRYAEAFQLLKYIDK